MKLDWELVLLAVTAGGYLAGAAAALILSRRKCIACKVSHGFTVIAAVTGLIFSLKVLLTGHPITFRLIGPLPGNWLEVGVDGLSAFFVLVISALALAAAIYAWGYVPPHMDQYSIPLVSAMFNLFILSMVLVVTAADAFLFLVVWETMAITSFLLVTAEQRNDQARRAGYIYLVMTHIGTALIVLSFLILYQRAGALSFAALANAGHSMPSHIKDIVFLLALVGFGTKAGIIPLHVWLPEAHPAAPSHVSALMSGVMIKTAVYGLLRVIFLFLGGGAAWWGVVVLALGCVSALLGVMYALMEHDIKRLLAFHSVENIGIILMGLGASIFFNATGQPALAALGLAASLYHLINHALFKGLLFLGAGAVVAVTHTRDMEQYGGLIRSMPWTALFFLVGSLSIAALPPFNGFVSEWLTYQALLGTGATGQGLLSLIGPVAGAALALTGALAAACFVKAFGITFLAQPRSERAGHAVEAPFSMLAAMALLGALCLFLGVFPGAFLDLLSRVLVSVGLNKLPASNWSWNGLILPAGAGSLNTGVLAISLMLCLGLSLAFVLWRAGRERFRTAETWACGIPRLESVMEYTSTSFAKPIRLIFQGVFHPTREVHADYEGWPYFPVEIRYRGQIRPFFEDLIYRPALTLLLAVANQLRKVQAGSIHLYLGYILITLVILLVLAI